MSLLSPAKFRHYRTTIAREGVRPIRFLEWSLGKIAGHLLVRTAVMAQRRGDTVQLNHALLTTWIGNRHNDHLFAEMPPAELSRALKEKRIRVVVDPHTGASTMSS